MKRPQHLYVTAGYPPRRGIFAHRTVLRLQALVDTTVFLLSTPRSLRTVFATTYQVEGIPVRRIPVPLLPKMTARPWAARLTALITYPLVRHYLRNADIIEAHSLYFGGAVVSEWCKIDGIGTKATVANATGDDVNLYLKAFAERNPASVRDLLRSYDAILCRSGAIKATLHAWGAPPPELMLAPRGVDTGLFSPTGRLRKIFPEDGSVRFLYLGGFPDGGLSSNDARDVKGGLLLLEAWRKAEPHLDGARLAIYGPGCDSSSLAEWQRTLAYPRLVHISGGDLPPDSIPDLMRGFDCIVIPSRSEGLPNVVNEAQASGLGVVASNAGGIPEAVVSGVTARLFPAGDVVGLTRELVWCASHPQEVDRMGLSGRKRVDALFSWDSFLEKAALAYGVAWSNKYGRPFPSQRQRESGRAYDTSS